MSFAPRSSSLLPRASPTMSSPPDSIRPARSSASGASDSAWPVCPAWRANPVAGARPAFPPSLVVQVKALACELPHRQGLPLSRFSIADLRQEVLDQGLVAEISGATVWRWLSQDAIRPWRHRSWIFPRDPLFVEKAGPILDLYQAAKGAAAVKEAEVRQQQEAEAERQKQAEERTRKIKEALGDEITAHVSYLGMVAAHLASDLAADPSLAREWGLDQIGYQIQNLRMFINRKNGSLTVSCDCRTGSPAPPPRPLLPDSECRYHPCAPLQILVPLQALVRLFDANGEYLTHFITAEYFAAPHQDSARWEKDRAIWT